MSKQDSKPGMDNIQDESVPMPTMVSEANSVALPKQQHGYPLSIIPNGKADEKFCCSYCKYILRNPMQSSCGHRFCQDCLGIMQCLPGPMQCQSCIEEGITDDSSILDFQGMFEDKAARREMKKLQVKCVSQGCPWRGSFNDFLEHEVNCEKKLVSCSLCGTNVTKARLLAHETKTCPKRTIHCNYCREQVVYELREKHNEECPKYLIKCDKCNIPVERSKVKSHQETVCANRMISCPVPDCNTKVTMDKFLPHISKDEILAKHIVHLIDKSELHEQRLTKLEKRCQVHHMEGLPPSTEQASTSASSDQAQASAGVSEGSQESGVVVASERTQGDCAQAESGLFHEDRQKLKLHEDLMSVLHAEILRCITKGEALGRGMDKSENRLRDCYAKLEDMAKRVTNLETRFTESGQTPFNEAECGDLINEGSGNFTWIVKGFSQVKRDAVQKEREMVCSPTFFSGPGGYLLRLKLYANGEGGENTNKNMSLFLQIVRGPNDALLIWPFSPKVYFMLVDQIEFRQHHVRVYEADPMSPASRRPTEDASVASGCPAFISVNDMSSKMPIYWPQDVVYLKFHIETPKTNQDRLNSLNPLSHVVSSSSVRS